MENSSPTPPDAPLTIVWIGGASCDGCTTAALGASAPGAEALIDGALAPLPAVRLVHQLLSLEAGDAYRAQLARAASGDGEPFVLVVEGSLLDEGLAGDGYFSRLGAEGDSIAAWIDRLAPHAEAVVAVGTCAASGGVPAAAGSVTGAHGLEEHLGEGFRARSGLPVVNVPGCAPAGEVIVEALIGVLRHLARHVPLELDGDARPRWLYSERALPCPPTADWRASDPPAQDGPAVDCAVAARGWMRGLGGCASVGGACIGCTAPGFADRYMALARPHRA